MSVAERSAFPLSRLRERARVRARTLGSAATDAERKLWSHLRDRRFDGCKFRGQHPIGPFIADFACIVAKLVIELDGGQHYDDAAIANDARRTAFMASHGFHVLRFSDRDVLLDTEAVLSAIHRWLVAHPHPSPLPHAGEGVHAETTTS